MESLNKLKEMFYCEIDKIDDFANYIVSVYSNRVLMILNF